MSALAADRNTKRLKTDQSQSYPVAASTTIYAGALVCLNTSGYAVAAAATAGYQVVGVAKEQVDNSSGSNGDESVEVHRTGAFEFTSSGLSIADEGKPCWITDDNNVTTTPGDVFVGILREYVSATSAYVDVEPATREAKGVTQRDSSRNELLAYGVTASAVNHVKVTNAATGNNPSLTAVGDDTNVGIDLDAKAAGAINVGSADSKLGHFGATAVVQQSHVADPAAAANDITDSTGGSASGSHALVDVATDTWDNEKADVENNFATIAAEYNALKDDVEANNAAVDSILALLETYGLAKTS